MIYQRNFVWSGLCQKLSLFSWYVLGDWYDILVCGGILLQWGWVGDMEKYITVRVAWYLALPEHLPLWHIAQQQNFFCLSSFASTFFICFSFLLSFICWYWGEAGYSERPTSPGAKKEALQMIDMIDAIVLMRGVSADKYLCVRKCKYKYQNGNKYKYYHYLGEFWAL